MAAPHARATVRLDAALQHIAFACGGEGGARLACQLSMPTSADTLLRAIRRSVPSETSTPRVLGVDDWAMRRGQRYGTILCDLEQRRPIDLLPERSSEQLSRWLRKHPGVQIISRDRGGDYAKGATEAAPQAIQVADRFHLLRNLHGVMVRVVDHHHTDVLKASRAAAVNAPTPTEHPVPPDATAVNNSLGKLTRDEQIKFTNRHRRQRRYQRVVELHRQGLSFRAIARQMGMHRGTVRRFVRAGCFPERATRRFRSLTDPWVDHLRRRWETGCRNAAQMARELKAAGIAVSYHMVRRRVAHWRRTVNTDAGSGSQPIAPLTAIRRPSSTRVAWILMKHDDQLLPEECRLREELLAYSPVLRDAAVLADEFADLMRRRRVEDLGPWLDLTAIKGVCPEMRRFANGLTDDLAAVQAALTLSWSNGQVEGQINRLKLVKRQMYGRANFDLLRSRFLHAG
jgi:transposase